MSDLQVHDHVNGTGAYSQRPSGTSVRLGRGEGWLLNEESAQQDDASNGFEPTPSSISNSQENGMS